MNYLPYHILVAVILDLLLADPINWPHPVIYIGKAISFLEKQIRKITNKDSNLRIMGLFIVLIISILSFGIPYLILYLLEDFKIAYHLVSIVFIWTTIAARGLDKAGIKVYNALYEDNIEKARLKLSYIVGRDTRYLNKIEIIKADIETISENTSDGVIAPLFYAMIGGAPLAMLYKGINTMDSMLGYKNDKYIDLGFFPAKVDDIANYIPARITGVLMCLVSPVVGASIKDTFKIMIRDRHNHTSPNCAYPESATAGALKIQLGGSSDYFGKTIEKPTIGDNIKLPTIKDIKQTIYIMYSSEILFIFIYIIIVNIGGF